MKRLFLFGALVGIIVSADAIIRRWRKQAGPTWDRRVRF